MPAFPRWRGPATVRRRLIQLGFLAIFVALPLLDLVRFDFGARRLHLFRAEIWLDEWTLLWLALMFGMWIVGAVSLVLGRVYCAYACPQTVFSELAHDADELGKRLARRLPKAMRARAAKAVSWGLAGVLALAATVLFMGYFAPLGEVVSRLARLDVGLWIGAVGAATTLLGILNLVFVREGFCRSVCPYGLLQGVLEDGRSLHVALDESTGACIDCKACVKVCPMGIDIREGAYQIECTRCGSCVDICDAVLAPRKRPGILAFRFGADPREAKHGIAPPARVWDVKRVLVAAATAGFGVALALAVLSRETLALHVAPVYTEGAARGAENAETRFLLRAANRGRGPVTLSVTAAGLPAGARLEGVGDGRVAAGEERRFTVVVTVPRTELTRLPSSVVPFTLEVAGGGRDAKFPAAFYAPSARRSPS
jgi:polyferredoxin